METNDIVKSVSIENMTRQREAVAELLRKAHALLTEAGTLAESAHLAALRDVFTPDRYAARGINFIDPGGVEQTLNYLDGEAWQYLMNESGLRTFMDAKARSDWDDNIYKGNYPPLTRDNISATFEQVHASRGDLFDRGVINCFKRLSWDYKTNRPFYFGKRIIVNRFLDVLPKCSYCRPDHRAADELDDLVRVFHVLDGKPEPDHRVGIYSAVSAAINTGKTSLDTAYFKLQWYKKGSAHLTFARQDLVDTMNKILAKHHPDALACDN